MFNAIAIAAAAAFVITALAISLSLVSHDAPRRNAWMFPAILSGAFATFSITAVIQEGPMGFWTEHTRNLWGNQIWFDLLLAAGIAWTLLVPRARELGMRPLPWLVAVICTGSIGLCAMWARVLYISEARREVR
ncbi:hypothetical protein [Paracidovorax sp. MALMAid1276]|uniref:hypothetical protein n=1 Tax=Paracidovorax sp. MALMAid1276 TaxID=3411631 RepID=UPI003B9D29DC